MQKETSAESAIQPLQIPNTRTSERIALSALRPLCCLFPGALPQAEMNLRLWRDRLSRTLNRHLPSGTPSKHGFSRANG